MSINAGRRAVRLVHSPMQPRRSTPVAPEGPTAQGPRASADESPEVRELLETLDDAIFAALGGCPTSLEAARKLWPAVVQALGWELVEESREQYLRYAVEVTRRFETQELRDPSRALAALEVIELLTHGRL